MTRWIRSLMTVTGPSVFVAVGYVMFFGTVDWRYSAIRNQGKVIALLAHARSVVDRDSIQSIVLGDKVALTPDRDQIAFGYVLTPHVRSTRFAIGARPVEPGKTGLFSYYLDEAGVVRFEMGEKQASATSRPSGRATAESR